MHLADPKKRTKLRALFQSWLARLRHRIFGDSSTPIEATVLDLTGKAYAFGKLAALEPPDKLGKASLASLEASISSALASLGPVEAAAVEASKAHAGAYLAKLAATIEADVMTQVAEADKEVRARVAQGTAENIAKRETVGQLATALGRGKEGWRRDWRRVANTEKTAAMSQGAADVIAAKPGPQRVYKLPSPTACPRCKALYLDADGEPVIFTLDQLVANGTNHGRKAADWKPVVGTIHPNCQCSGPHHLPAGWILSGGIPFPSKEAAAKFKKSHRDLKPDNMLEETEGDHAYVFEGMQGTLRPKISPNELPIAGGTKPPKLMLTPQKAAFESVQDLKAPAEAPPKRWEPLAGIDLALNAHLLTQPNLLRKAQDAEDEPLHKAFAGAMQTGHKYTSRAWMKDHWIYKYAEKHGGKVEGHVVDPDRVVLKLPSMAKVEEIKGHEKLAGTPWQGPKYAAIEISKDEATKMLQPKAPASAPAALPKLTVKAPTSAPAPKKSALDTPPELAQAPKHEAADQPGRKGTWKVLKSNELKHPSGIPPFLIQRGEPVSVEIDGTTKAGVLVGFDHAARPQVEIGGEVRTARWNKVKPSGEKRPYQPAHAALPEGAIVAASDRQRKLFERALELQVVGKHKPREFIEWLTTRGHEVYVVGGVPRDMVAGTSPDSKLTDDEVFEKMKDVDIVTTAPSAEVKKMFAEVAADVPNAIHWDAGEVSILLAGGPKVSKLNPEGLDVSTMVVDRGKDPSFFLPSASGPKNKDTGQHSWGLRFDHSLEGDTVRRDFAANTLYYDPINHAIIDPTLKGIEDAQRKHLSLSGSKTENAANKTLPARFWKFRMRGYNADPATKAEVRKMAEKFFQQGTGTVQKDLLKQGGKVIKDPVGFLAKLKTVMTEDGCGDLYAKHVQPYEKAMIATANMKAHG